MELPQTKVLVIHRILNLHVSKELVKIESIYISTLLLEHSVHCNTPIRGSISRKCFVMVWGR